MSDRNWEKTKLPLDTYDDLIAYGIAAANGIAELFENGMPDNGQILLADAMKTFAGEYHQLFERGLIPEAQQYRPKVA